MNKILTKVTALCVGLAMVAGVGVAVGSKRASEAKATDYTKIASYNFNGTGSGTSEYTSTDALKTRFADSAQSGTGLSDIVSSVTAASKVYASYTGYASLGLKFGTSGANGTFTVSLSSSVVRVVVVAAGWSASDNLKVGSAAAQTPGVAYTASDALKTLTYDITESSSVQFTFAKRGFIQSIDFYEESQSTCTHNWVAGTVHAATCTENGYTEYECSLCHETKQDDVVAALGHDWSVWTEVTPATCLTAGEEQRVCNNDSTHVETRPIAALGHSYVDGICERCGAEQPSETTVGYVFSEHYSTNTILDDVAIAVDENITVEFATSGTATQYYTNGTAVRWYSNATLTISSSAGNITSISIVYSGKHDNAVSANVGSYTDISAASGTANWVGDASTVVFTEGGSSGHDRIASLSITYDNGGEPPVTYTITYLANASDAEGSMSPTTGSAPEVASCTFTRDGYEFARWNTQADGEGDNYAVGTSVSEDLTLYVIWQEYVAPIEGNVTMEGVTSASAVTVNGHPGLKCGAGSTAGAMKLVLSNSSISKIKVYVAGWKGDTSKTINIEATGCSLSESSISVVEDSAITGSATAFTLTGAETTYRFTFVVSNATAGAEITLTAAQASKNRFVVWGATDLFAESFAEEFEESLTCDVSGDNEPTFASGKSWTTLESFYNGLDGEEQDKLKDATFTVEGSGSSTVVTATGETSQSVAEAMARYDFIEGKYNPSDSLSSPYKNFIGRTVHPLANSSYALNYQSNLDSSSSITIIVIVAVASMTLLGVTLVLRKRKHQ